MNGKQYAIIYADPPWRYKNWSMGEFAKYREKAARRVGRPPYLVMHTEDICALPVSEIAEKDCVLFLWGTWPKLLDALRVIEAWGFEYKSIGFVWVKLNPSGVGYKFGLGFWTRGNTEFCLLATKGCPKRVRKDISQLVIAPVRDHSRKPDEVRRRIVELMGDLPRIELFAREKPEGWDVWGNEVENSIELESVQTG